MTRSLTTCIATWAQPCIPTRGPHCVDNLASDSQHLLPTFVVARAGVSQQELFHLRCQRTQGQLVDILRGHPFAEGLVMLRQTIRDILPDAGNECVLRHELWCQGAHAGRMRGGSPHGECGTLARATSMCLCGIPVARAPGMHPHHETNVTCPMRQCSATIYPHACRRCTNARPLQTIYSASAGDMGKPHAGIWATIQLHQSLSSSCICWSNTEGAGHMPCCCR